HILKPRLRMRQIPDLEFRDDRSMEYAEQISSALREIREADAGRADVLDVSVEPAAAGDQA
ncbi:MAG TPA: hypothetical protein VEW66_06195, partial [Thermomicrobiales bacterium]|nr:hypothetical protein [Thermomicrobiales bacterium]